MDPEVEYDDRYGGPFVFSRSRSIETQLDQDWRYEGRGV